MKNTTFGTKTEEAMLGIKRPSKGLLPVDETIEDLVGNFMARQSFENIIPNITY